MRLFKHVPAKEINSPPGMSAAVMITPNCAVTHKIASLCQDSNCLSSYRAGRRLFSRNTSFLIKHIISHIAVKV